MPSTIQDLDFRSLTIRCDIDYSPGSPGKTAGPPENCYPPEPEEFVITKVSLQTPDGKWMDVSALVHEGLIDEADLDYRVLRAIENSGAFDGDPDEYDGE